MEVANDKGVYEIMGTKVYRYEYRLMPLCEDLHASVSGSGDPLLPSQALRLFFFLRARLNDWTESPGFTKRYDDAVKALCSAACEEYMERDMQRDFEILLKAEPKWARTRATS